MGVIFAICGLQTIRVGVYLAKTLSFPFEHMVGVIFAQLDENFADISHKHLHLYSVEGSIRSNEMYQICLGICNFNFLFNTCDLSCYD